MNLKRIVSASIILIPGLVLCVYLMTLREGHPWGDDFAMYILHAKSILEGRPYSDIGFIPNPAAIIAPRAYPPLFPLMMTPVIAWAGINLDALKLMIALLLALTIALFDVAFRDHLNIADRVIWIGLFAFNPVIMTYKDLILSDVPFLALVALFIRLTRLNVDRMRDTGFQFCRLALIGLVITAAALTRRVGIVLLPCLLTALWLDTRSHPGRHPVLVRMLTVGGLGAFAGFLILFPPAFFTSAPDRIFANIIAYLQTAGILMSNGRWLIPSVLLYLIAAVLILIGFISRLRTGISMIEITPVALLLPLLFWDRSRTVRYMLPIVPFPFFHPCIGMKCMAQHRIGSIMRLVVIALIAGTYAVKLTRPDAPDPGVESRTAKEVIAFIRSNTAPDDVLISAKPRAFALFTGRAASNPHRTNEPDALRRYMTSIHARYAVAGRFPDDDLIWGLVRSAPDRFRTVFSNEEFTVYQLEE